MGARAAELGICVEGKYIWHNLEIQYASNQQQEKHKHFRRACVSPRGIMQWNNFIYHGTNLFISHNCRTTLNLGTGNGYFVLKICETYNLSKK
jgi:hypothetical protein